MAMRSFSNTHHAISVIFILFLCVWCNGQEEEASAAPMEETEKEALYSTIQGFVGNWWNGTDLYPDPCGWTPIQVLFTLMFTYFAYLLLITSLLCLFDICRLLSCIRKVIQLFKDSLPPKKRLFTRNHFYCC